MNGNTRRDVIPSPSNIIHKLIAYQPFDRIIKKFTSPSNEIAEAIINCPSNPDEREKAFKIAIGDLQDSQMIQESIFSADLEVEQDRSENTNLYFSGDLDMPPLPSEAYIDEGLGANACNWLDKYVYFSRLWAPRAFEGFHEASGIWLLSTIAARRVMSHMGKPRFTNLYIALISRTSFFTKTTTTDIAIQTVHQAGLDWLLADDNATPQKFISNMANQQISGFDQLTDEQKQWARLRAATAGQRGWYYEEFGQHIRAMMSTSGFMADFRGILRRWDDTPNRYAYATIGRGTDVVEHPYLALLANITPDDLRPFAQKGSSLWGDGFLARYALITPNNHQRKRGRFPEGERIIPADLIQPLQEWHQRLGVPNMQVVDVPGTDGKASGLKKVLCEPTEPTVLSLEPDVSDAFYAYHDGLLESIEDFKIHDLDGNYARMAEKALRVAMLLASVSGSNRIELKHWARAQAITERWRAGLHSLFAQINQLPPSLEREKEEAVLRILRKMGPATAAEVARFVRGLSGNETSRLLDGLVNAGAVVIRDTTQKRTKRYSVSGWES
jgi:hypothetical protein